MDLRNRPIVMIACSPQQIFAEYPLALGLRGSWWRQVLSDLDWLGLCGAQCNRVGSQAILKRDLGRNHQSLLSFSMALCDPQCHCRSRRTRDLSPGPQELIPGGPERRKAHSTGWHRPSQKERCGSSVSVRMCMWSPGVRVEGRL